ncbi:type II CAAX endopeptidase family protein [Nesterenkonia halobia]|uniref:CAAX prenyl protease 2/Lysostaphin resistance protein A-like domain-containing protein n=1 Tax=Nesterenkonia halobia TaxID=37922 RepID=A0ABP6RLF2_9MICC
MPLHPAPTPRTPWIVMSTYVLVTLALAWAVTLPLVVQSPAERTDAPLELHQNLFLLSPLVGAIVAWFVERRQPLAVLHGVTAGSRGASTAGDANAADAADDAGEEISQNGVTSPLRRQHLADALGLTPLRPVSRLISWCVLALLLFLALTLAALGVGALLGVYPLDLSMPLFTQDLARRLGEQDGGQFLVSGLLVEVGVIVVSAIATMPLHATAEMGWRGWFFPRLQRRLGPTAAVLATGVLTGAWHTPLLAVGFHYTDTPLPLAVLLMCGYCVVIGGLLAWMRMRSGSIWPAAFAQSMITAATILHFWFAGADPQFDYRAATLQGWSGWIIPGVLLGALLLARRRAFAPTG